MQPSDRRGLERNAKTGGDNLKVLAVQVVQRHIAPAPFTDGGHRGVVLSPPRIGEVQASRSGKTAATSRAMELRQSTQVPNTSKISASTMTWP